ncbi:MAG TPA: hypothetical protein VKR27_05290, partial [Acidimicrobiales bacterium]|nr:hypothetical protein [Acidimicrobiales bacterium]
LASTGLGGPNKARVVRADALTWSRRAQAVDIAVVDPPYAFDGWQELLERLSADLFVLESRSPIELPSRLSLHRTYHYGGTLVTVARKSVPMVPRELEGDR